MHLWLIFKESFRRSRLRNAPMRQQRRRHAARLAAGSKQRACGTTYYDGTGMNYVEAKEMGPASISQMKLYGET